MRKSALILMLLSTSVYGQINFVGENVELYVGKDLKVKPVSEGLIKFGYRGFIWNYNDNSSVVEINRKNIVFPGSGNDNSIYDSLNGKLFKCISYEKMKSDNYYALKLQNERLGTCYYIYSSKYERSFPFEVIGGVTTEKGFYCNDIEEKIDKFTSVKKYNTPYGEDVLIIKGFDNGNPRYFISLSTIGSTPSTGEGVIILLENGEKLNRPSVSTKVRVNSDAKFEHSAFFELSIAEVEKLKSVKMTDAKLYIFEMTIKNPDKIKDYVGCLLEKN